MDKRVIIDGPFLDIKDTPELKRYLEFVINNKVTKGEDLHGEKHHLFPRALYPQFKRQSGINFIYGRQIISVHTIICIKRYQITLRFCLPSI